MCTCCGTLLYDVSLFAIVVKIMCSCMSAKFVTKRGLSTESTVDTFDLVLQRLRGGGGGGIERKKETQMTNCSTQGTKRG